METTIVEAAALGGSVADLDFSILALFLRADVVVKAVIVLLFFASIWCWAIIFEKLMGLRRLNARASDFESAFWSGSSLDELYDRIGTRPGDPMFSQFAVQNNPSDQWPLWSLWVTGFGLTLHFLIKLWFHVSRSGKKSAAKPAAGSEPKSEPAS